MYFILEKSFPNTTSNSLFFIVADNDCKSSNLSAVSALAFKRRNSLSSINSNPTPLPLEIFTLFNAYFINPERT